ncbi:MAG: hypothetical protein RR951_10190, partial [Ruthenibacterium sp.]
NGTGKSTLMAAFLWLLIGKDAQGRESYNIFPLDADGKRVTGCDPSVTAVLEIEGRDVTLQRTTSEKWTKRRGAADTEYSGDETRFFADEVPISASAYANRIATLFPEKLLPLMLNATWFQEQTKDYKERRRMLLEQFGGVTFKDVCAGNPALAELANVIGSHSVEEFEQICIDRRKRYRDALTTLPARIDENRQQLRDLPVADAIVAERSKLNVEICKLQYAIGHLTEDSVRTQYQQELNQVQQYLDIIPSKKKMIEAAGNATWLETHGKQLSDAELAKHLASDALHQSQSDYQDACRRHDAAMHLRDDLRAQWITINAEAPVIADTCPTCGQTLPAELVAEARENFNLAKSERLTDIAAQGTAATENAKVIERDVARLMDDQIAREQNLCTAMDTYNAILSSPPPAAHSDRFKALDDEEQQLLTKAESLQNAISKSTQAAADASQDKQSALDALRVQSDRLTAQLTEIEHNVALAERIETLESEQRDTLRLMEDAERGLSLCQDYTRTVVAMLTDRVNEHFPTVRFKLFEDQKNGGLREICEATVDGVPYGALNTAAKMQANIEIV